MKLRNKTNSSNDLIVENGTVSFTSNLSGEVHTTEVDSDVTVRNNEINFFANDELVFKAVLDAESQMDELEELGFMVMGRV